MINITSEQARQRFKTLSEPLQDAIFSTQTAETIRRIAEQNHILGEKIPGIAEAVGLVFLGYIHPEEAAKEIEERSGIPAGTAKAIADSLYNRLFNPLKKEIDAAYAPLHEEPLPAELPVTKTEEGPRIIEEVKKIEKTGTELIGVLKEREAQKGTPMVGPAGLKRPVSAPRPGLGEPRPPTFKDYGEPRPPTPGWPASPTKPPKPPATATPETGPVVETPFHYGPGPVIIHKEIEPKPLAPKPGFRLEAPAPKFSSETLRGEDAGPAQLEIGKAERPGGGLAKSEVIKPPAPKGYGEPRPPTPIKKPEPIVGLPEAMLETQKEAGIQPARISAAPPKKKKSLFGRLGVIFKKKEKPEEPGPPSPPGYGEPRPPSPPGYGEPRPVFKEVKIKPALDIKKPPTPPGYGGPRPPAPPLPPKPPEAPKPKTPLAPPKIPSPRPAPKDYGEPGPPTPKGYEPGPPKRVDYGAEEKPGPALETKMGDEIKKPLPEIKPKEPGPPAPKGYGEPKPAPPGNLPVATREITSKGRFINLDTLRKIGGDAANSDN